jgi:hypothetical protein
VTMRPVHVRCPARAIGCSAPGCAKVGA